MSDETMPEHESALETIGPNLDLDPTNALQAGTGVSSFVSGSAVYYERLPMLEVVFDRLVRLMTTSMRNFTGENVEISLESISSVRFGDYMNSIPVPAMVNVFLAEEWDNHGIVLVDTDLIYTMIDVLFRGTSWQCSHAI